MMNTKKFGKKKAISPILATVILIAITLVAAVAIAGFVFGLFGTLSGGANIQVTGTVCSLGVGSCILTMTNTGSAPATANTCAIYGTAGTPPGTAVVAGSSGTAVSCVVVTTTFTVGEAVSGTVTMSNGITIPFSGVWIA